VTSIATLGVASYWLIGIMVGILYYLIIKKLVSNNKLKWLIYFGIIILAIIITTIAERILGTLDPPAIVLDEVIAVPLALLGSAALNIKNKALNLIGGVVIFGLFDLWKPLGINLLSELPGGIGIVADDIAAALLTSLFIYLLHGLRRKQEW
jgi:phosphatidylglycerophosphatase A